jgi:Rnk N-terminus
MKNSIYVTSQDKQRLQDLLAVTAASGPRQQGDWKALADELRRAVIVEPNEVPADVITMNSRAGLIDLDTDETATFTLVFPQDAFRRGFRMPGVFVGPKLRARWNGRAERERQHDGKQKNSRSQFHESSRHIGPLMR